MEYTKNELKNMNLNELLKLAKEHQITIYTYRSEQDLRQKIIIKYNYICNENKKLLTQIKEFFNEIPTIKCFDCKQEFREICTNTLKTWQNNKICDHCHSKHNDEINQAWNLVRKYKPHLCVFCGKTQNNIGDRFHYDHLNMFDKAGSVCDMIKNGDAIELIYHELDKCQSVCINCHHKITFIEQKLGFTKSKIALNKMTIKNSGLDYNNEKKKLYNRYKKEMKIVYEKFKDIK